MSKTHRKQLPEHPLLPERLLPKQKPRQLKRQRQREAMEPPPLEYPTREPVPVYGRMG